MLRVRDIRGGVDLLDRLEGCRWTSVAWLRDGNSFYYARPPLPGEPAEWDRHSHHLFHHQLGYPQTADRMVWYVPRRTNVMMTLRKSYGTNQLLLSAGTGTDEKEGFWVGSIFDAALLTLMYPIGRSLLWPFRNNGGAHFAVTDLDTPRNRIVRMTQGAPRFAASAEWLSANRITRLDRLGIFGASNGGRPVLATMLQRPELFGAVVSGVPVADMIRFPKFTFGGHWRPEYGDPEKPDDFNGLMAYSPLHDVKPYTKYPP